MVGLPDRPAAGAAAPARGLSALQRNGGERHRPLLLCLSPAFAPVAKPTAIRASRLVEHLSRDWDIIVLTEQGEERDGDGPVRVERVRSRRPRRLLALLARMKLAKLIELAVWPDDSVFWVPAAIRRGRQVIRERAPDAIVVFMMPYSAGLAGVALSRLSGLPLVLNLDDSPTCTDMHPSFPTRLHHRLAIALENLYVRRADEVIYVSKTNLERVAARQPAAGREKLRLVRYGAEATDFAPRPSEQPDRFEVAYVGAMSGWWSLLGDDGQPQSTMERAYDAWMRLGRHEIVRLDPRSSSPAFAGQAIVAALDAHPEWRGRVRLGVYGNPYPDALVERGLAATGVQEVVDVTGPLPHERIAEIVARADLLFLALPKRLDGSAGGRISAKTYEYLATDRPILAAVPRGENRDYLEGKPGVWVVEPDDVEGMRAVIEELAATKLAGNPQTFDRSGLSEELSYATRAREFAAVVQDSIKGAHDGAR